METFGIIGMIFGIIGMSAGTSALTKLKALEEQLRSQGLIPKSDA